MSPLQFIWLKFTHYRQFNLPSFMKNYLFLFLICSLLFNLAYMIGLQHHKEVIEHQKIQKQNHKQDPASAAAAAAAQKGTELIVQKLIDDPAGAAKIPSKFIQGRIQGLKEIFEGSWNIKGRTRSLQLTFSNLSNRKVIYVEDYFDSGTWYRTWQSEISPKYVNQGLVANKQGSWFCGVTGGIKLRIDGTGIFIYLGFNNPYLGGYKNYGELAFENKGASYGYDRSYNNSPKLSILSGFKLQVVQTESQITQMAFVYQLSNS